MRPLHNMCSSEFQDRRHGSNLEILVTATSPEWNMKMTCDLHQMNLIKHLPIHILKFVTFPKQYGYQLAILNLYSATNVIYFFLSKSRWFFIVESSNMTLFDFLLNTDKNNLSEKFITATPEPFQQFWWNHLVPVPYSLDLKWSSLPVSDSSLPCAQYIQ